MSNKYRVRTHINEYEVLTRLFDNYDEADKFAKTMVIYRLMQDSNATVEVVENTKTLKTYKLNIDN